MTLFWGKVKSGKLKLLQRLGKLPCCAGLPSNVKYSPIVSHLCLNFLILIYSLERNKVEREALCESEGSTHWTLEPRSCLPLFAHNSSSLFSSDWPLQSSLDPEFSLNPDLHNSVIFENLTDILRHLLIFNRCQEAIYAVIEKVCSLK